MPWLTSICPPAPTVNARPAPPKPRPRLIVCAVVAESVTLPPKTRLFPCRTNDPAPALKDTPLNTLPAGRSFVAVKPVAPPNTNSSTPPVGATSPTQLAAVVQRKSEPPPSHVRVAATAGAQKAIKRTARRGPAHAPQWPMEPERICLFMNGFKPHWQVSSSHLPRETQLQSTGHGPICFNGSPLATQNQSSEGRIMANIASAGAAPMQPGSAACASHARHRQRTPGKVWRSCLWLSR